MLFLSVWSLSNHFQTKVFPSIKSNKKIKIVSILTNKKKHNFKNKSHGYLYQMNFYSVWMKFNNFVEHVNKRFGSHFSFTGMTTLNT